VEHAWLASGIIRFNIIYDYTLALTIGSTFEIQTPTLSSISDSSCHPSSQNVELITTPNPTNNINKPKLPSRNLFNPRIHVQKPC
jgi:hypothetical protein